MNGFSLLWILGMGGSGRVSLRGRRPHAGDNVRNLYDQGLDNYLDVTVGSSTDVAIKIMSQYTDAVSGSSISGVEAPTNQKYSRRAILPQDRLWLRMGTEMG